MGCTRLEPFPPAAFRVRLFTFDRLISRAMNSIAHFAIFWIAGLLTGTLLGWMLGRSAPPDVESVRAEPERASESRRSA